MQNLTEFLLARLAEDEGWIVSNDCICSYASHPTPDCPDRVLSEVAVKRAIVEQGGWGYDHIKTALIRGLASVYADHPDYREEWRL